MKLLKRDMIKLNEIIEIFKEETKGDFLDAYIGSYLRNDMCSKVIKDMCDKLEKASTNGSISVTNKVNIVREIRSAMSSVKFIYHWNIDSYNKSKKLISNLVTRKRGRI